MHYDWTTSTIDCSCFCELLGDETLQGADKRVKFSTNKQENREEKKTQPVQKVKKEKKNEMKWDETSCITSPPCIHHTNTQPTIPYRGKRRKMAQACRNDNDKGEHFTCSNTTHTEHTPLPHSQHTAHKAVRQIEKWFISHKHSHPAPYAKWSEQICLSIALLRHRRAHLPTIQHELSLHSQTLHCPAIASSPHRTWLSLNMLGFRFIILLLCRTGLRSLLSLFKHSFSKNKLHS